MSDDEEGPKMPTWEGAFDADGLPNGKGLMKYPPPPPKEDEEVDDEAPTDMYEGEMSAGKRHGKGKYTWANGAFYDGEYKDNLKHGRGTRKFPDGSIYEGEWVEDKMSGNGRYVYANGDIFLGSFHAGLKHGSGSYFHAASKSQYIGEWSNGSMTAGRWVLLDGTRYEGTAAALAEPYKSASYTTGVYVESRLLQDEELYPLQGTHEKIPIAAAVEAAAE